jgi:DNA-binding response OmpR family regulator
VKIFEVGVDETTLAFLRGKGFSTVTDAVETPEDLYEWLVDGDYEVVVINLDKTNWGIFAVRYLRSKNVLTSVIGLSMGDQEGSWSEQRASFLENGGDDFIHNPANPRELAASVGAIVRRSNKLASDIREFRSGQAHILIDLTFRQVKVNGIRVPLTTTELRILEELARRPGFLKSRASLMSGAYEDGVYLDDRIIDSHIKRMRKKLSHVHKDAGGMIQTIYGGGYKIPTSEDSRQKGAA